MSCLHRLAILLTLTALCTVASPGAGPDLPRLVRIFPLGGQAGTEVAVEMLGERLANTQSIEFDCRDLVWTHTSEASTGRVKGVIRIAPGASLGPHMLRAVTADGYSTSVIFNVEQFVSAVEIEPNDKTEQAQMIDSLPAAIQGRLDGAVDRDVFAIRAKKGERRLLDFRAIESGSAVEARMYLLDGEGQPVHFNDDRDDINENPLIDHTFDRDGTYYIKLDQYRGPRGFNFGKSCAYILRISNLPRIEYVAPLGLRSGRTTRIRLAGSSLERVEAVYLTQSRRAEYRRMTYPYTMPIHFRPDPESSDRVPRIPGKIVSKNRSMVEVEFAVPADTEAGIWRVWASGSSGVADGPPLEIAGWPEFGESEAERADWKAGGFTINGSLSRKGEKDVFRLEGMAGRPMHFWTLATQLGAPRLDSVLEIRDESGKKVAENDDVVAGQGTLLGNPDSSLYFTPKADGVFFLSVSDRVNRGGADYQYRLKVASERPGFQLFTTPENFTAVRGGTGVIKVHLIREAGFEGEVSVWFEGMPPGVEAPKGWFRADQLFEPNADGADMIIPDIEFAIQVPETLAAGTYPMRVVGAPSAEEKDPSGRRVEAHGSILMGPLLDLWNYIRRPLPRIEMTVVPPFESRLITDNGRIRLSASKPATLKLKTEQIPENALIRLANLPSGVTYDVTGRQPNELTMTLRSSPDAAPGEFEISAEAQVGDRWASSRVMVLSVASPGEGESAK